MAPAVSGRNFDFLVLYDRAIGSLRLRTGRTAERTADVSSRARPSHAFAGRDRFGLRDRPAAGARGLAYTPGGEACGRMRAPWRAYAGRRAALPRLPCRSFTARVMGCGSSKAAGADAGVEAKKDAPPAASTAQQAAKKEVQQAADKAHKADNDAAESQAHDMPEQTRDEEAPQVTRARTSGSRPACIWHRSLSRCCPAAPRGLPGRSGERFAHATHGAPLRRRRGPRQDPALLVLSFMCRVMSLWPLLGNRHAPAPARSTRRRSPLPPRPQ